MTTEILAIPEENLREFIVVIRAGLRVASEISEEVRARLELWCDEEEEYLDRYGIDE